MPSRRLRDYRPHPRAGRRPPHRCPDRHRQPPAPPPRHRGIPAIPAAGRRTSGPEPGKGAMMTAGAASRTAHLPTVRNKGDDLRPGPPGHCRGSVTRTGTRGLLPRLLSYSLAVGADHATCVTPAHPVRQQARERGTARPSRLAKEADMIVRRPLAGRAAARGDDPLEQEGSPVPVPVTVEPPAGRFTACVVST